MFLTLLAVILPVIAPAGNTPVTISDGPNQIRVTVLAPDVVRVRYGPGGRFANDDNPEFVIVNPDGNRPDCPFTVTGTADRTIITTGVLTLDFHGHPPALTVTDSQNRPVFAQDPADFSRPTATLDLAPGEHIYGFGDKRGPLDQRGRTVDLWNKDAFGSEGDDSYKNVPFYMSSRGYGLYLHNWWRTAFDVGATVPDRIRINATGGELDYYVFYGPSFKRILGLYTELTGRPALQPLWFFGYHQGKASYKTAEEGLKVAREMRNRRLPCDAIYYDDTGPAVTAEGFARELRDRYHIRLTLGLGNPQVITGSPNEKALAGINGLITGPDGTATHYYTEETEDDIANPDFFSASASDLFFDLVIRPALERGGELGMLDFGELEYVPDPGRTWFPGIRRTVAEMHNIYGLVYTEGQITRAARYSGGSKRPGRPVGMLRCGTAGSQRTGWTTTGDSEPTYSNFRAHLRGLLSLSMCGFSNIGYDIGGWDAKGPDDLYAKWFLAGMFNPFAWAHGQGDHEPYAHGAGVEKICRAALERRYRLLPYLYSLNYEASRTGIPMMRTLVMETGEESVAKVDDEFMLGPWLLVAPLLGPEESHEVVFPSGVWTEWGGTRVYRGPGRVRVRASAGDIPVFVRGGAILPMGPVMQYTGQKPLDPLTIEVHPAESSSFTIYEDDGESPADDRLAFATTPVECSRSADVIAVTVHERTSHSGYTPGNRDMAIEVHGCPPKAGIVTMDGGRIPRAKKSDRAGVKPTWTREGDVIRVVFPGHGARTRIEILE